jgi:membrane protein insertase Oxa1/YidC/SpoIIIJ
MQLVSIGFIVLIVINSPTGVGVYYFLSSIISIAQTALIHYLLVRDKAKHGTLEIKLQKLGLE